MCAASESTSAAAATRWAVMEDGAIVLRGEAGAFNGHLFRPEIRAAAEAALAAIAAATGQVESVVAGVSGMTAPTPQSRC